MSAALGTVGIGLRMSAMLSPHFRVRSHLPLRLRRHLMQVEWTGCLGSYTEVLECNDPAPASGARAALAWALGWGMSKMHWMGSASAEHEAIKRSRLVSFACRPTRGRSCQQTTHSLIVRAWHGRDATACLTFLPYRPPLFPHARHAGVSSLLSLLGPTTPQLAHLRGRRSGAAIWRFQTLLQIRCVKCVHAGCQSTALPLHCAIDDALNLCRPGFDGCLPWSSAATQLPGRDFANRHPC